MGTQTAPAQLFYDFDLDDHVLANYMLRDLWERVKVVLTKAFRCSPPA